MARFSRKRKNTLRRPKTEDASVEPFVGADPGPEAEASTGVPQDDGYPEDGGREDQAPEDTTSGTESRMPEGGEDPVIRKPEFVDKAQRRESLRSTLLKAAYTDTPASEEDEEAGLNESGEALNEEGAGEASAAEDAPDPEAEASETGSGEFTDFTELTDDERMTTRPVRVVEETLQPLPELHNQPEDARFATATIPLTRSEKRTTVNPDFATARAGSRTSFDGRNLDLPDSPVYRIPDEERDALNSMSDIPERLDVRAEENEEGQGVGSVILEFVKVIVLALIIGLLLTHFVIQRSIVDGSSMHPTLFNKDQLIVEKVSRYFAPPARGRIVTLHHPDNRNATGEKKDDLVKRVVGLPGESVSIEADGVYINGVKLEEPYLAENVDTRPGNRGFDEVTLADDEIYVLGDNRSHSSDSRAFGPVKLSEISGAVWVRIWPFDRIGAPR